jgi:hypothetical protein
VLADTTVCTGKGAQSCAVILQNCFLSFGAILVEKMLSEKRREVEL